jgi:hypothetical protein
MVTSPVALPPTTWASFSLDLRRFVSQAQSGGRLTNVMEYADPLWTADFATKAMQHLKLRPVEAWWHSLRGGLRSVLYRHPSYSCPAAHIASRGPELDSGLVSTITAGNVLAVSSVAAGLILAPGDFVTVKQGAALYAVGQIVAVSGTGTARTIEVEPPLPMAFAAGAVVYFDRIEMIMRPVATSWQANPGTVRTASFQLIESRA